MGTLERGEVAAVNRGGRALAERRGGSHLIVVGGHSGERRSCGSAVTRARSAIIVGIKSADPFVKCFLIKAYCLSLYDCTLWSLSCKSLNVIEVAINNEFRKVWNLPFKSHTAIVHCVARIFPICNLIFHRFNKLYSHAIYITLLSYCQVNLFTLLFPHLHILWSQLYVWAQIFKVL